MPQPDSQNTTALVIRDMDTTKVLTDDTAKPAAELATPRTTDAETATPLLTEPAAAKRVSKALLTKSKTAAKSKKSKKAAPPPESDSSDSDTDSDSDSDSDAGSSSDSDSADSSTSESDSGSSSDSDDEPSDREADKKRRSKKRRDAKKTKKRKPKRRTKTRETSTSSGSDSGSEAADDGNNSDGNNSDGNNSDGNESDASSRSRDSNEDPDPPRQRSHRKGPQHALYYGAPYGAPYSFPYGGAPFGYPMATPFMPAMAPAFAAPPRHRSPPPRRERRSRRDRSPPPERRRKHRKASKHRERASKDMTYKRVDMVWDSSIHDFKLQDTADSTTDTAYEGYLFHVRRTFDWEGQYKQTFVDIKSKVLRDALQEVMGDIKGVSLVEEIPKLDPNLLFIYLEDMRTHLDTLKNAKPKGNKKRRKKELKNNKKKRQQLKVLVKYIDKDYEATKKSLKPMLENGLITFDLLWALWKPNTLAYTTTYGSADQPRVFKMELADKHSAIMKGQFYYIEGKYFEYVGKRFGYGTVAEEIGEFRGTCKITSLPVYPLKYHKNEAAVRQELIERGKRFVALSGVQYKSYEGMAYVKRKKTVVRVNVTGRIMIDFSTHRRINPNYPTSIVHQQDGCDSSDSFDSDDSDVDAPGAGVLMTKETAVPKNADSKDGDAGGDGNSKGGADSGSKEPPVFSDDEYLMASPVVLGFAFTEKLWLEFSVSNVKEIQWNDNAYESLVLEPKTKDIVKALVESHKYHAAESIDDVIQGKGKGLVAVLHGPPGTGKTLTAEGISELLKCPLYMVSAGELGTDSRYLELELQRVLDICHAWGAILLLDEADVFLEKRNMHDIQRNALVSIFLRQLEYFQGILFLTTNRVETFDDAFQSRIHIALRYGSLDQRAKKTVFKIFIERVRVLEKIDTMPFTEDDYTTLARHDLNGRQIKNTVRTAQALAVNKGEPLSMGHIRQVLDVQMSFDRDLKGGPGFQDAMRSYF